MQEKVGLIKIDVNTWWQKGTGQGKGLLRKLLRECRREFKEVGWLPLHNKQLILSIPSRFDNRYTEAEAIQAAFLGLRTTGPLSWLFQRAQHRCHMMQGN